MGESRNLASIRDKRTKLNLADLTGNSRIESVHGCGSALLTHFSASFMRDVAILKTHIISALIMERYGVKSAPTDDSDVLFKLFSHRTLSNK
jgi:hypothetical protein